MPAREIANDAEYRRWVQETPTGFVLNTRANPAIGRAVLHKSHCSHIRAHESGLLAGSTSRKFVAHTREELLTKARQLGRQSGAEWRSCGTCGS